MPPKSKGRPPRVERAVYEEERDVRESPRHEQHSAELRGGQAGEGLRKLLHGRVPENSFTSKNVQNTISRSENDFHLNFWFQKKVVLACHRTPKTVPC